MKFGPIMENWRLFTEMNRNDIIAKAQADGGATVTDPFIGHNYRTKYEIKDGSIEFYIEQKEKYNYKVTIEDIDGVENGGEFISKDANITDSSFVEVVLDKKI